MIDLGLFKLQSYTGRVFWCCSWSIICSTVWTKEPSLEKGNSIRHALSPLTSGRSLHMLFYPLVFSCTSLLFDGCVWIFLSISCVCACIYSYIRTKKMSWEDHKYLLYLLSGHLFIYLIYLTRWVDLLQ